LNARSQHFWNLRVLQNEEHKPVRYKKRSPVNQENSLGPPGLQVDTEIVSLAGRTKKHITSRLPSDTSSVKGGSGERFTGLMELSCLPCFNELRQDAWKNARQFNCAFALCLLNRENHSSIGNSLRRQDPTFHGWKLGSLLTHMTEAMRDTPWMLYIVCGDMNMNPRG